MTPSPGRASYPIIPIRAIGGGKDKARVCNTVPGKECSCSGLPSCLELQGTQGYARKDGETPAHHHITFVY